MKKNSLLLSIGFACSLGCFSCDDDDSNGNEGLIATDAQLVNLGSNFSFTEGPAVDKNGNVFFTIKWDGL
jgi:gluconolactonase